MTEDEELKAKIAQLSSKFAAQMAHHPQLTFFQVRSSVAK
jgi:hypothetical protein